MKLSPYLNFAGNAEEAFELYKSAFGGDYTSVVRFKDMPMEGVTIPPADQNKIMHISLKIGDEFLMASDALESLGQTLIVGNNNYISITPDSKEQADQLYEALSADGAIEMAMGDQPWGAYFGSFKDRFGVQWMINYTYPKTS